MIISRTPYRISFFGGGTDYHTWYQKHGSAVLSTTINHYCYLHCRNLAPFFKHKSRIVWSKIEEVARHADIQHPAVNAVLEYLQFNQGIEVNHQGDLPARSGLGSSSAFTVGLLHAVYGLRGMMSSKRELACEAIHIERDILKENVGVQDQIATAYGGLNKILVHPSGDFEVTPLILPYGRAQELQDHLLLFFTGVSRTASDIAADKIKSIPNKSDELHAMRQMVDDAEKILCDGGDINRFGELLHEAWMLKRQLSSKIAPAYVDEIYAKARAAGAVGGKLLGAGGGGFMLFFVDPERKLDVCDALEELLLVPFEFESSGSQIIFYDDSHYSQMAMTRRDYRHLRNQDLEDEVPLTRERLTRLLAVE
ncbi:D-glycero-alpha-D-manno-heptose 7-phosphate kinase [Aquicella siphonis]|uniref:D-glycero-alpha-D-manno-heptose 7-phosphate kinase n=1 Tax=Aquicella siphonis TaxID=254247 RepID=A0A5E4PHG6_9COXI|nr:kinase [Aquicella siphonis]VVC76470.1 D-glycero-alpha-D-manno-heptose 7-phosphate kinase [Aquicella siphonis]